ncbi:MULTISPECIES: hypothetical protein [unclassified Pseudomonas]|uniref:hypothetical protein n=1 Tax=unclassified Pseudomonas TaxID=196821 RepID=UPI001CBF77F1|nr:MULTISPECIES: hypothetical protein [unclassified Pseudomonas]
MTQDEWLAACVKLTETMDTPTLVDGSLVGDFQLTDELRAILKSLELSNHFLDRTKVFSRSDGDRVHISVDVPRSTNAFYAEDWTDLLTTGSFSWDPPKEYFILKGSSQANRENYAKIIRAARVLEIAADYVDPDASSRKLIYLGKKKLEIFIVYSDLNPSLNEEDIKGLELFLEDADKHKNQRHSIIKASLQESVGGGAANEMFELLLKKFSEFARSVEHGYALYVSEFSYEKILEDATKAKLDFHIRINKLISEMQNQLLAIPAAFIFVGTQFKSGTGFDISKLSLIFGVLIFGVLMDILIRNQKDSMSAIQHEIEAEVTKHIKISAKIRPQIEEIFSSLVHRSKKFKQKMFIIELSVSIIIAFTMILTLGGF